MKEYGLIGFPLSHSFSGKYFANKFKSEGIDDCVYHLFPLESLDRFPELLATHPDLWGLNVTIPYKEKIIPYLDSTEDSISAIGAVNTIKIIRNRGQLVLKGYNTDVYGFGESLKPFLKDHHQNALILGTGGASKAVLFVLEQLGIGMLSVSRTPRVKGQVSYEMLTRETLKKCTLIINTSPLGMYPDAGSCPAIPYEYITKDHILFDLVYNPEETLFMKQGKAMGATVLNGLKMLHLQAEKSWEIWNSKT
jgi:shikimate dehydrogenase